MRRGRGGSHSLVAALALLLPFMVAAHTGSIEPSSTSYQEILASDGGLADAFGYSIATDFNRMAIGIAGGTPLLAAPGQVYVFDRTATGSWAETILTPSGGAESRSSSYSVALSGARVVAGGPYSEHVYLFEINDAGAWHDIQIPSPDSSAGDRFGWSVAIDGDRLVVGAPNDDDNGTDSGSIFVFDFDDGSWQGTKLSPSDGRANDEFGWSVAVAGDVVVAGQPHRFCCDPVDSEAVYVFEPDGTGDWKETKLTPSSHESGDSYGYSVAASDGLIAVGAPRPNGMGAAYVYERVSKGVWTETELSPADSFMGDDFGHAVAVLPGQVVVGAPHRYASGSSPAGTTHIFAQDTSGFWIEEVIQDPGFNPPTASGRWFGYSVAATEQSSIVGAPHDDTTDWDAGIVYEFAEFLPAPNRFTDDDGNVHEQNIEFIAGAGITNGCNPPANDRYCPAAAITRGEMAAFLDRALHLPTSATDAFTDDDNSIFEESINRIAAAGITRGCNPPDNNRYCPDAAVTREEMAAFIARGFHIPPSATPDFFSDDDGSLFEESINAIGAAGIARGCNPPDNSRFCPQQPVQRDEMASFLARSLTQD